MFFLTCYIQGEFSVLGYTHVETYSHNALANIAMALPFAQVERVKSAFEKADKDSSLGGIASGALRTHVIRDEKV